MATSDKLTENYLTCIICAEVFTNPTTLHCDHTFCRPCLVKYTKTQPDALQAKSIPCPSCRQMTRVTSPEEPVEDWVNQVKPNHLIQGLMEDFGPGIDRKDSNTCDVCRKEGETTEAKSWCIECGESLCDNCLKMHRRFAATSVHEVTPLVGEKIKQKRKSRFMCSEHTDEQVKLFCKDCRKAICHICCSISHRQCMSVVTLENVMTEATATLEKKRYDLKKKIKGDLQQLANQKERMDEVTRNACMVESEIKQTSQEIQDEVLKKERKLLGDLAKLSDTQKKELTAGMKSKEITIQGHRQEYEFIDLALKSESQKDIFAIFGSWVESVYDSAKEDDTSGNGRIRFTQENDQLRKAIGNMQLGEVNFVKDANYRQELLQPNIAVANMSYGKDVNYRTSSVVLEEVIDFQLKKNTVLSIFDVVVLTLPDVKIIVVIDFDDGSIKAFYKQKFKSFTKVLKIGNFPWQITMMANNEIAAFCVGTLVFVKFQPEPVVTSTVDTGKHYYGIACVNHTQLVAGTEGTIDVLSRDGKIAKSISKSIHNPYSIHITQNADLLVSNLADKSVVSMTMDGKVKFTYRPTGDRSLTEPRGIITTRNGDILFTDKGSNKVIQLTDQGKFVRELLTKQDGLGNPRGLYLDEDGLLYIASTQYVRVYKFV